MNVKPPGTAAPGAFARRVLQAVSRIPSGRVATYGDIARLAGRPRAARSVGRIIARPRSPDSPTTA
ncbi:MAG: MGMT family protein [Acidobacteriota bacterium]